MRWWHVSYINWSNLKSKSWLFCSKAKFNCTWVQLILILHQRDYLDANSWKFTKSPNKGKTKKYRIWNLHVRLVSHSWFQLHCLLHSELYCSERRTLSYLYTPSHSWLWCCRGLFFLLLFFVWEWEMGNF